MKKLTVLWWTHILYHVKINKEFFFTYIIHLMISVLRTFPQHFHNFTALTNYTSCDNWQSMDTHTNRHHTECICVCFACQCFLWNTKTQGCSCFYWPVFIMCYVQSANFIFSWCRPPSKKWPWTDTCSSRINHISHQCKLEILARNSATTRL